MENTYWNYSPANIDQLTILLRRRQMKKTQKILFIGSLASNLVLLLVVVVCWRQAWRVYVVEVQTRALGLVVFHSTEMYDQKSLSEIVEMAGDKSNLENMGIVFDNGCVKNQWGDRFELIQRISDGKYSVHPVGPTFTWP